MPRTKWILFILFFAILGVVVILCLVPPVSKDALVHHLAVPKLYLRHGGIYEIPHMPFSYYPMNLDLLYMLPLHFGNDIAAKLIHFSFGLLTAGLLFRYLRRRLNSIYGLFGMIFFLSIPIIVKLSITVYVDLGLVFFSTAALLLLFKWLETQFRPSYLLLSALCCGLAMGTKYNGLITFLLLTLFVPFMYSRCEEKKRYRLARIVVFTCLYAFTALLIFSPWMLRDYFWTGNPIYPLYDNLFNPHVHTARKSIGLFTYRTLIYREKWWEILLLPLRIFFQGQDGNPQFFDGKLNPFLLIFSLFAFRPLEANGLQIKTEKKVLLFFVVLYFAFAFFSAGLRIRYISPIIPPLVILSAFGIKQLFNVINELESYLLRNGGILLTGFSVLIAVGLNAIYICEQFSYVKPLSYISGKVSRDEYIEKYRPEYPAMKYINTSLPIDSTILFVFMGNRGYYCDRQYKFDMRRNKSRIAMLLKSSHDPWEVCEGLKRDGITHMLINTHIFNKWASQSFSYSERAQLEMFFKEYMYLLYYKNGYAVFELTNEKLPAEKG